MPAGHCHDHAFQHFNARQREGLTVAFVPLPSDERASETLRHDHRAGAATRHSVPSRPGEEWLLEPAFRDRCC